jgi:hypothetical protein
MRRPTTWRENDHLLRRTRDGIELIDTGSPISMPAPEEAIRAVHPDLRRLVGMDELARGPLVIDWTDGLVKQPADPSEIRGMDTPVATAPLTLMMGIPSIEIRHARRAKDRGQPSMALIDTGAPISYAPRQAVEGLTPVGEASDFLPMFGEFTTPLHRVRIEVLGEVRTLRVGVLPPLLEAALGMLSDSPWILGAEFLKGRRYCLDVARGTFAQLPRAPWLQRLFDERLHDSFCGNIHCTTCGGGMFDQAITAAAAVERGIKPRHLRRAILTEMLTEELRNLEEPVHGGGQAALVSLLYRYPNWGAIGAPEDAWIWQVVRERARIDDEREEARATRAREAEAARVLKAQRKIERAEAHRQRLEAQKERNAKWHREHPGGA